MKKIGTSVSVIMLLAICLFGMLQMGFQPPESSYFCCEGMGYPGITADDIPGTIVSIHAFGYWGDYNETVCVEAWADEEFDCELCPSSSTEWDCWDYNENEESHCTIYNVLLPPTHVQKHSDDDVWITWIAAAYAQSYRIEKNVNSGGWSTAGTTSNTYYQEDYNNDNIIYRVYSVRDQEESEPSSTVQYTTPVISPSPSSIAFIGSTVQETKSNAFTVNNTGDGTFSWEAEANYNWITTITPDNGDPEDNVSVTVNRSNITSDLDDLTHYGSITVSASGLSNATETVSVNLIAPSAPTNLVVSNAGNFGQAVQLGWTAPATAMVHNYRVYRKVTSAGSWTQIGTSSSTSYTDTQYELTKDATVLYYYVKSWNAAGLSTASNTVTTEASEGSIANQELADLNLDLGEALPDQYSLHNCYPNPANPGTTIQFQLPEAGNVELIIVNITGRTIKTLVSGHQAAGTHQVTWNGHDENDQPVSTGMYFYIMRAGGKVFSKKFSLVK